MSLKREGDAIAMFPDSFPEEIQQDLMGMLSGRVPAQVIQSKYTDERLNRIPELMEAMEEWEYNEDGWRFD